LNHDPAECLYKTYTYTAAGKDGSIHNLVFSRIDSEELDNAKNKRNQKNEKPYPDVNHYQSHFFAEEVPGH
jgi:hypothetical protein